MNPDFQKYERLHLQNLLRYSSRVQNLYEQVIEEILLASKGFKPIPGKDFSFDNYPELKKRANRIISEMNHETQSIIVNGVTQSWNLANEKNDNWEKILFQGKKLPTKIKDRFFNTNMEALDSFLGRKEKGLDLSERVWRYTDQFRNELESGLQVGITEGIPARQLAKEMKQYLGEPNNLFRRVRDPQGRLQLSKSAAAYHPGQGVYRSSFKNSLRLTRTEMNMSYRTADHERWNELPFVLGFEVRLSGSHPVADICDDLKGKYPKEFKFSGWHPQCLCHAVPVLPEKEDFGKYLDGIIEEGTEKDLPGKVSEVPSGFSQWVSQNAKRVQNWKSTPYFIKDNFKGGDIEKGMIFSSIQNKVPETPIIKSRTQDRPDEKPTINYRPEALKDYPVPLNDEIFSLLADHPIEVTFKPGGSYAMHSRTVNISMDKRWRASDYFKARTIYHEFGHVIDSKHGWRIDEPLVNNVMAKHRKLFSEKHNTGYFYTQSDIESESIKFLTMGPEELTVEGYTRKDAIEALSGFADTIMSLNKHYGYGHTKSYFSYPDKQKAEFIAHAFENYYSGNKIFERLAPELYQDMIEMIGKLIESIKQGRP